LGKELRIVEEVQLKRQRQRQLCETDRCQKTHHDQRPPSALISEWRTKVRKRNQVGELGKVEDALVLEDRRGKVHKEERDRERSRAAYEHPTQPPKGQDAETLAVATSKSQNSCSYLNSGKAYRNGKEDKQGVAVDAHVLQERKRHAQPLEEGPQDDGSQAQVAVDGPCANSHLKADSLW